MYFEINTKPKLSKSMLQLSAYRGVISILICLNALFVASCVNNCSIVLREGKYFKSSPPDSVKLGMILSYRPTGEENIQHKEVTFYKVGVRYKTSLYDEKDRLKEIYYYDKSGLQIEGQVLMFNNGVLTREYQISGNKLNGEFVEYDGKGELQKIYVYDDNKLIEVLYDREGNYAIEDSTYVPVQIFEPVVR